MIWVLRMGPPKETQPVLPGNEVSSGSRAGIWKQPLTCLQSPCPEAVGTIISQDNEQLQDDRGPWHMTGTQWLRTLKPVPIPHPKSFFGGYAPSTPTHTLSLTCTISLLHTLVSSFRLCTLEIPDPRARCCPVSGARTHGMGTQMHLHGPPLSLVSWQPPSPAHCLQMTTPRLTAAQSGREAPQSAQCRFARFDQIFSATS